MRPMSPLQQLHAGRLPRRIVQLIFGLFLYGVSLAFLLRGALGIAPWDVLAQGIAHHIGLSYGQVTIAVSILVLMLWIPLRQWPGLGTICNAFLVGIFADLTLSVLVAPSAIGVRIAFTAGGIVLNALAGAIYIGAQLGPGPRDGLMTGLVSRTGRQVWMVRMTIEVLVVIIGAALGGDLWIGTVAYAVCMGPLVQAFLPLFAVRLPGDQLVGVRSAG
jgi:uncharacterized membrane protein YczE